MKLEIRETILSMRYVNSEETIFFSPIVEGGGAYTDVLTHYVDAVTAVNSFYKQLLHEFAEFLEKKITLLT